MIYNTELGVWICDSCQVVKVPTPTSSFKLATTWGRGTAEWEYIFWIVKHKKNKLIVICENMVAIDMTDMFDMDMFSIFISTQMATRNISIDNWVPGQKEMLDLKSGSDWFTGYLWLVRSPDDI